MTSLVDTSTPAPLVFAFTGNGKKPIITIFHLDSFRILPFTYYCQKSMLEFSFLAGEGGEEGREGGREGFLQNKPNICLLETRWS